MQKTIQAAVVSAFDEVIAFAVQGKAKADITTAPLSDINKIFARMKSGKFEGRMVLTFDE